MDKQNLLQTRTTAARLNDTEAEAAVQLINAAYARHAWLFPVDRTSPAELQTETARAELLLLKSAQTGDLLALTAMEVQGDALFLSLTSVSPAHHGQGYGAYLIRQTETIALKQGLARLALVAIADVGNVDYYRRFGFSSIAQTIYPAGAWGAIASFTVDRMEKHIP